MRDDDDDRLDLSSLAPSPASYERLVQRTLQRARATPPPLVRWSTRLIAASVVVMLAAGVLAWLPHRDASPASLTPDALSQWALSGEVPREVDLGSFGVDR